MSDNETLYCSFCGKSQHNVRTLIAGPIVFICNECILLCVDVLLDESRMEPFTMDEITEQLAILKDTRADRAATAAREREVFLGSG